RPRARGRRGCPRAPKARVQPTVEDEPPRGEGRDRAACLATRDLDVPDRDGYGDACGEECATLADAAAGEPDDGDAGRNVEAERARRQRPVDEDSESTCRRGLLDRVLG